MGIRINKVLGYGLTDFKGERDERFNSEWIETGNISICDNKDFENFIIKNTENTIGDNLVLLKKDFKEAEENKKYYSDCWIHYSSDLGEYIKKCPIVFSHIESWERYDNSIDHYDNNSKDKFKLLGKRQLYPYFGYVDSRTGKKPVCQNPDLLHEYVYMFHNDIKLFKGLSKEIKALFGLTLKEFEDYIWPKIPLEIQLYCEFFKIFKNPLTVHSLQPMIYTYWS